MMKRLQNEVIDLHPDLVIWQVGTNAVLRNLDPGETAKLVEDGVAPHPGRGLPTSCWSIRNIRRGSPSVAESASKMVKLLGKVAELRHVGIFPRFEVMREWHEKPGAPGRELRHRRRPAHERLGLCLLRAAARRRHHPARSARSSSASTCRRTCGPTGRCEASRAVGWANARKRVTQRSCHVRGSQNRWVTPRLRASPRLATAPAPRLRLTPSPAPPPDPRSDRPHARARPRSG